jgi:hypothetical protein
MAYVMALQQGWPTDKMEFKSEQASMWTLFRVLLKIYWPMCCSLVNNDIRGLIDSVNDGSTSAFMWEWFTTKPFVVAGECRFVSSRPLSLFTWR